VDGIERDLLFGALALRQRLIDEAGLKAAVAAWRADPSRSLPDHLEAGGHIDAPARESVDALVASLSSPTSPGEAAGVHERSTGAPSDGWPTRHAFIHASTGCRAPRSFPPRP